MAYCTTADVYLETGTSLGTITGTDVTGMITRSDEEIVTILANQGITSPPVSDNNLKTASIQLTIAKIKRRQSHELSRPNGLSLGGDLSFSVNTEAEAQAAEAKGRAAIADYITSTTGTGLLIVRNHHRRY